MSVWEVLLIAFSVSLDAFALSVAGALTSRQKTIKNALLAAGFFGGFQFFMPLAGFLAAALLHHWVELWDHWIAFALLAFVGGKMVYEGICGEGEGGEKAAVTESVKNSTEALWEDGSVKVNVNNVPPSRVPFLLRHEIAVHEGLTRAFGEETRNKLLDAVWEDCAESPLMQSILRRYGLAETAVRRRHRPAPRSRRGIPRPQTIQWFSLLCGCRGAIPR